LHWLRDYTLLILAQARGAAKPLDRPALGAPAPAPDTHAKSQEA